MAILLDFFLSQIEPFERKVVLFSGGYESTVVVYEFFKKKIDIELLYCDTGNEIESTEETINKIVEITGYPLTVVKAKESLKKWNWTVEEILNRSQKKFEEGILPHDLPCRYNLKIGPMNNFVKKNYDPKNTVLLSCIASYESRNRLIFLNKLRRGETFLFHKKVAQKKFWYAYPLRDCVNHRTIPIYLEKNNLSFVKHSHCKKCPVALKRAQVSV